MRQINSIPTAILTWILSQRGGRGKNIFFASFLAEPIFAKSREPRINFFFANFCAENNTLCWEITIFANM